METLLVVSTHPESVGVFRERTLEYIVTLVPLTEEVSDYLMNPSRRRSRRVLNQEILDFKEEIRDKWVSLDNNSPMKSAIKDAGHNDLILNRTDHFSIPAIHSLLDSTKAIMGSNNNLKRAYKASLLARASGVCFATMDEGFDFAEVMDFQVSSIMSTLDWDDIYRARRAMFTHTAKAFSLR